MNVILFSQSRNLCYIQFCNSRHSSNKALSDNANTTMATEVKKAVDLGLLEEDDEFEEFPAESKCCY